MVNKELRVNSIISTRQHGVTKDETLKINKLLFGGITSLTICSLVKIAELYKAIRLYH